MARTMVAAIRAKNRSFQSLTFSDAFLCPHRRIHRPARCQPRWAHSRDTGGARLVALGDPVALSHVGVSCQRPFP